MGFLQPLALLGLGAVAVPPLLHLLGRRLPPTVVFPAVRYLTVTEREHSKRLKLRNLLLMLLRMMLIALIVLAAARPVANITSGGAHPPTAVGLVFDNSLSSGAVRGGRQVVSLLAEQAQSVLSDLGSGDELWLVLADGQPRRLGRQNASAILDTITAWPQRMDLSAAIRTTDIAVSRSEKAAKEIVVLSDLQATSLSSGDPVTSRTVMLRPDPPPANRGIDSVVAEPVVWSPSGVVIGRVSGHSDGQVAVRLEADDGTMARAVAQVGDRVALSATAERLGWQVLSLMLDPDELRADDQWWFAVKGGDPAAVNVSGDVGSFLPEALAVLLEGGRVQAGADVTVSDALGGGVTVLFPPGDVARIGAVNRALEARGVEWRFGSIRSGEWALEGDITIVGGVTVHRRYELEGDGPAIVTAGGEPWLVRSGDVIVVASRMETTWTELPVTAAFLPFLDFVVNRAAVAPSWIVRAEAGATVSLPAAASVVTTASTTQRVPPDRQFRVPLEKGVYFLLAAAGDTVGALEVNHDVRESDLSPADARRVRAALGNAAELLTSSAFSRELFSGTRRAELSGILLFVALVGALAELALATVGSRRQNA